MSYCEPPLNIDRGLERIKRIRSRIYRIGIEVEGWWDGLPQLDARIIPDGSVVPSDPTTGVPIVWSSHLKGEMNSPILEVSKFPDWMRIFSPQHSNKTCGLHVHISFKNALCYQRCMVERYPATIVEYLKRWATKEQLPETHPFWPRLAGQNQFCKHEFYADDQAQNQRKDYDHSRNGHRYTAISYRYSYLSTIECRLFPMFGDVEVAIHAVHQFLDITNAFLFVDAMSRGGKEPRINADLTADTAAIREVHISV